MSVLIYVDPDMPPPDKVLLGYVYDEGRLVGELFEGGDKPADLADAGLSPYPAELSGVTHG